MKSITERVCAELKTLGDLGLPPGAELQATPVLNWGGFVNQSFKVSSAEGAFHVKLADDPEMLRGLQRWRQLHETLSRRYAAPTMRGWIEISEASLAGPVFSWIEGRFPEKLTRPIRLATTDLVQALHRDRELALQLAALGDTPGSCRDGYESSFHDRFVEDLKGIRADAPPFLSDPVIDWMGEESEALRLQIAGSPGFKEIAEAPCHTDLWLNNLIVTPGGGLHIIDWDGLTLGDPMMDWAMLLGPAPTDLRPAEVKDLPDLPFSPLELERFGLYVRATILDWVIDPLADWVEAPESEHRDVVRDTKRRVHEEALSLYRVLYR